MFKLLRFEYEEFEERKFRTDVTRVFGDSCGYGHTTKDIETSDGTLIEFSKAGATYEEWLAGKKPEPVRELYCPYLWTSQCLQTKDKNDLYKTRCGEGTSCGTSITSCTHYKDKAKCWEIFEGKTK